jgi:hypothetical protein
MLQGRGRGGNPAQAETANDGVGRIACEVVVLMCPRQEFLTTKGVKGG